MRIKAIANQIFSTFIQCAMYAASKYGTLSVADVKTQLGKLSPSYTTTTTYFV